MKNLFKPFCVIGKIFSLFIMWFILILLFSHLGVIIGAFSNNLPTSLSTGSGYLIAITLLATSIAPTFSEILINYFNGAKNRFLSYKLPMTVISIFIIVIMSSIYSNLLINIKQNNPLRMQIIFWGISLLFTIYLFCLQHLHLFGDEFDELDKKFLIRAKNKTHDDDGVAL